MTETPGGVKSAAPRLGQHTDEVLAAAGFEPREIGRLRQTGAVA
jgi:crotonobetainyl-CoA:carnitine CoA-transferase CaiB-like acyl-CoA transferase